MKATNRTQAADPVKYITVKYIEILTRLDVFGSCQQKCAQERTEAHPVVRSAWFHFGSCSTINHTLYMVLFNVVVAVICRRGSLISEFTARCTVAAYKETCARLMSLSGCDRVNGDM